MDVRKLPVTKSGQVKMIQQAMADILGWERYNENGLEMGRVRFMETTMMNAECLRNATIGMFAFFGLNISALPINGIYHSVIFGPVCSHL